MITLRHVASALLCLTLGETSAQAAADTKPADAHWVAAWTAPADSAGPPLSAKTVRHIVRPSVGGSSIRIRLSNLFGTEAITIGAVRVAKQANGSAIQPKTDSAVTFGGKATVTIASGGDALSDPIPFPVAALENLAVSLYVPPTRSSASIHGTAVQTAYIASGDVTAATTLPASETDTSRFFLTDIEVAADAGARTVVILGDSITDGIGSTEDANARWPDALAARLQAEPKLASVAVVNAGISGNRLLNDAAKPFIGPSMSKRFDRDVLSKPGVRWVVLFGGINDINAAEMLTTSQDQVSARQLIDGMQRLIARAHAKGIRIAGATLMPLGGVAAPFIHNATSESKRQATNTWIRTGGAFDAVIDFDALMRDPARPDRLRPDFDSGDHLHPNDAGHRALAAAVDLRWFDAPHHWVAAWSAAPDQEGPPLSARTIRQIVRPSIGGSSVRLRLSNLFGTAAVTIGPVRIAKHAGESAIQPGTDRVVTFSGKQTVTIAKGADVLSDPVVFPITAFEQLAISLYVPDSSMASTLHGVAMQTAFITQGEATTATKFAASETDTSRFFLTDLEVATAANAGAVVVIGDSVTDGVGSTDDRNTRWPDALAERLRADPALASIAVVNSGIAGNRVLNDGAAPYVGPSILSRFDRDALSKPGVRWIVLLTGSNDISASDVLDTPKDKVSAQQIIAGMQQLIARAHAKGIKVYGATLLPKAGVQKPLRHTPEAQAKRRDLNAWIRTSGAFDAVVDFERLMADPVRPDHLAPAYDSGDHLHPNDTGYKVMAAAIDLRLFRETVE